MSPVEVQPGKKSYWFGKGYADLRDTVKSAWGRNVDSIKDVLGRPEAASTPGIVARAVFVWAGVLAIAVFGSIITVLAALLNLAVVATAMAAVYLALSATWLVDRVYLLKNRIFTACHHCKEKSLIPAYACGKCGVQHTHLVPGVYGIWHRTCTGPLGGAGCGAHLPTSFMNHRSRLWAVCKHCGTHLNDRESRPLVVPVVGGRSVGKTAFITAFSYDFIEQVAPDRGLRIEVYSREKEVMYSEIGRAYGTSNFALTPVKSATGISSVSFSFFVQNPELKPERLVHVYDIAGEVFTQNIEIEVQKQYEYCHGIVLIVDPLAIDPVFHRYEQQMDPIDRDRRGVVDVTMLVDSFFNKLREVTGLSDRRMHSMPMAVVLTKIDAVPDLNAHLGRSAARSLMDRQPDKFKTVEDAQDHLCRQFFIANDMRHFVTEMNVRFRNNRYFACSPIGHTATKGAFRPEGVMTVMDWIISRADPKLGALVSATPFTSEPPGKKELR
jgi:GTPase SAR1 family protein